MSRHTHTIGIVPCLLALLLAAGLVILIGCTAEQAALMDKATVDANAVGTGMNQLVQGPAGSVLPGPVKVGLGLFAILAQTVLIFWQKNRAALTRNAAGAVIQAIEKLPPAQADPVKQAVGEQMKTVAAENKGVTYAKMNAEIDSLKVQ